MQTDEEDGIAEVGIDPCVYPFKYCTDSEIDPPTPLLKGGLESGD